MSELLQNPMFFYAIAFVIFLGIAWRYGLTPLTGWLDAEIAKVRDELENAKKLHAEADTLLADYRKKHAAAMMEAEAILRRGKDEAARVKTEAEAELRESLARHEEQAKVRIALAETEAVAAVRAAVITQALETARHALNIRIDPAAAARLIDEAITAMPKLVAVKAKAA